MVADFHAPGNHSAMHPVYSHKKAIVLFMAGTFTAFYSDTARIIGNHHFPAGGYGGETVTLEHWLSMLSLCRPAIKAPLFIVKHASLHVVSGLRGLNWRNRGQPASEIRNEACVGSPIALVCFELVDLSMPCPAVGVITTRLTTMHATRAKRTKRSGQNRR
jgi:hypothetical protein